ncbi:unnamed protein product [Trichogramma brassicae]|uniref:Uncharacterized protein n=1 Tax=Trichogramma brassicae TaxID=86971 RepID=A0A6H5IL26_9HYME|nr:unnamed protein product [Trichogramma brassicae]
MIHKLKMHQLVRIRATPSRPRTCHGIRGPFAELALFAAASSGDELAQVGSRAPRSQYTQGHYKSYGPCVHDDDDDDDDDEEPHSRCIISLAYKRETTKRIHVDIFDSTRCMWIVQATTFQNIHFVLATYTYTTTTPYARIYYEPRQAHLTRRRHRHHHHHPMTQRQQQQQQQQHDDILLQLSEAISEIDSKFAAPTGSKLPSSHASGLASSGSFFTLQNNQIPKQIIK